MAFYYRRTRPAGAGAGAGGAAKPSAALSAALDALRGPFVVADLETTGLSTASCEILEFAAVRVEPGDAARRE
ncbi:hypothetical protein LMG7053_02707 [Achromobacter ruhlandii]|nr:exonuclease domain-containing protein [Achromobacter ruhlandii]CAB3948618.1 hypothetical protein LMG7053_02707 [Achromobacter ruhlandii]